MARKMRGKAWVFQGLLDVDVMCGSYDVIRAKGLMEKETSLGKYAMIGVDPNFPNKVQKGDIIVGGESVGYGHDHDHPCKAIKGAGVAAIICESTNANFLLNCIHHGLPIIECRGINDIVKQGDQLEVDLAAGKVKNLGSGAAVEFRPFPEFILEMLDAGGLFPHLAQQLKAGKIPS